MKILWHSNAPWASTGYGQQTAIFCSRFKAAGHDVAIAANWGLLGAPLQWGDEIPIYPAADSWEKMRKNFPHFVLHHGGGNANGCVVISLVDVWVMTHPSLTDMKFGAWTPVDHKPPPPRVLEFFKHTGARPIAMSKFGEAELRQQGLDPLYVPHGIETNRLKPHDDRAGLREALGLPKDAFVVGMVANNQGTSPPRKSFPQVFEAFAELRRRHNDAMLYLHCEMTGHNTGVNLGNLAEMFNIPANAVAWTDQPTLLMGGLDTDEMSALYSAMDVLANPSWGEGFGIPIVEAQACGTPVIVTDWTAMPELCGAGWIVDGLRYYDTHHGAFFKDTDPGEIAGALLDAYEQRDNQEIRDEARRFALQYDADRVFEEHWKPVLEELNAPREVAPLNVNGNRAISRAKAKVTA